MKFGSHFVIFVIPFASLSLQRVEAWVALDPTVKCQPSSPDICIGEMALSGPSPFINCPEDFTDESECEGGYMGGWTWDFHFVEGLDEGSPTEALSEEERAEHFIGPEVFITLDDDQSTCSVSLLGAPCSSCVVCNFAESQISADCTNLPFGGIVECETPGPMFYPLDDTDSAGNPEEGEDNEKILEVKASLVFTFFSGEGRDPTDLELAGLMEQTKMFFGKRFQGNREFASAQFEVIGLLPQYDGADEFTLDFEINVIVPADSLAKAKEATTLLGESKFRDYIGNYVRKSEPYKESVFFDTQKVFFKGVSVGR